MTRHLGSSPQQQAALATHSGHASAGRACDARAGGRPQGRQRLAAIAAALLLAAGPALAQSSVPDPATTPGAVNGDVRQDNIATTICVPGWTRTVRPDWHYTSALKRQQLAAQGYAHAASAFEEDHLIPLSLGGSPTDPRNLWPEPREPADGWGADKKDELEAALPRLVCDGIVPLQEAQQAIARDWRQAYRDYLGGTPQ